MDGVSIRTYTDEELENIDPPPIEFDGKKYSAYDCTQMQRKLENSIRYWKRREMGEMDADKKTAITARLRRLHKKYKDFSKAAGLPEQRERMMVLYK